MTEDNRKENIHTELNRADDAIKAADLLFDNNYPISMFAKEDYIEYRAEAQALADTIRKYLEV